MRRRHGRAVGAVDDPSQQCRRLRPYRRRSFPGIRFQLILHLVPNPAVDDGFMLAGIAGALVDDIADIDWVGEQLVQDASGQWNRLDGFLS